MSQATTRRRRLNIRALIILAAVVALGIPALFGLRALQNARVKSAFLREARARHEKGDPAMALTYVNRYLQLDPGNEEAVILKSRLLYDTAVTPTQMTEAALFLVRVLGGAGDQSTPERLEARRHLIELSLKLPDRFQAALEQADQLAAILRAKGGEGAVDAATRRLRAEALEIASETASDAERRGALLEDARAEFEKAEAMDPGDVPGAVRLAALYHDRLNKDDEARAVLDRVVASNEGRPGPLADALLARAQFTLETKGPVEQAEADIDRALAGDPKNVKARLAAARVALQRNDPSTARKHLQAAPAEPARLTELKLVEGLIDLTERRPDAAIEAWRAGLVAGGGVDAELTWRLAQLLMEVGRVPEARVLVDQFRRLAGGEANPRYQYLAGLEHLKSNRPRDAITALESVRFKLDGALESQLQFAIGQAYEALRDIPKAIEAYRRSADTSREWSGPWLALAALEAAGDPDAARLTLRRGLALNPTDPKLLGALARVLTSDQMKKPPAERRWGEVDQILADADRAAPGDPDVALVKAEYLATTGKVDDAFALLEQAARLRPESPDLWLALAGGSARRSELGEALRWVDEGIKAAGPRAPFYITRASVHVIRGDISAARDALIDGIGRCPVEQRPVLWKTLGDLYQARREYPAARSAFEEWAKLQPENPDPRVALVLLAIDAGDEPAITDAIKAVRDVTGADGYYWRYARVEDLLRPRKGDAGDPAPRLAEARTLIDEILKADPKLPLGHVLEGRLAEAQGRVDDAIAAYRRGVSLNGGDAALNPLIALVVREKRDALIDELRRTYPGGPSEFDRLAAVQALRAGNKGRAEQLAALAVQGDPQGLDVRTWQAEVLQALGKPAEAEAALKALTEKKPAEPAPWLQLLMLRVSQGRAADALKTVEEMRGKVKTDFPELLWAQGYRAAGDAARAAESYEAALRRWPNDLGVLLSAVGFFRQSGAPDRADAILRGILSRDPSNRRVRRQLAEGLASRPGDRDAWDEALKTIGPEPGADDVPEDLLTRARVYALGDADARKKAIAILERLTAELPGLLPARDLLARALYADGQRGRARAEIAKVAEGPRATPDAVLFHAASLMEANEFDRAEAEIDRLARMPVDPLPVAELRSRLLVAQGKRGEAGGPLEDAFARVNAGAARAEAGPKVIRALVSLGQPEAAERVARALAGTTPEGYGLLAQLLATQKRGDEAAKALEDAAKAGDLGVAGSHALRIALDQPADPRWLPLADDYLGRAQKATPDAVAVLEKVALLRHIQKRHEEAVAIYKAMAAKNPLGYENLNNMAWKLAVDLDRPEEALPWADKAVAKGGRRPESLDTRGVILTKLDRPDDAIRDLEAAVAEAKPASPSYFFHLALAYKKKGDLDRARAQRDQARDNGLNPAALPEAERADWDALKDL